MSPGWLAQRQGHADGVVQVALRVVQRVFLRQYGGHQFLGRGLAVGAGDADDGRAQRAAMVACQLLQGLQAVVHQEVAWVAFGQVLRVVDDGAGAAVLQGLGGKGVAVERLAPEGDEQGACGATAAVGGDARALQDSAVEGREVGQAACD